MSLWNELFGNADQLIPSLVDMVTYPFGGGTAKEDRAYFESTFNYARPNEYGGYGSPGSYGPFLNPAPTFATDVHKTTAQAIKTQTIVPLPSASSITSAAGKVVNAVVPSNLKTYLLLGFGALLFIKLLRR